MKIFNCLLAATFSIGLGLAVTSGTAAIAAPAPQYGSQMPDYGYGPNGPHPALRSLIERTQNDLRMARRLEPNNNEDAMERYNNAQKNLSSFDRKLFRGQFDKDKLGHIIGDLKNILKKNTLQVSSRNALTQDLAQFEVVKTQH